MTTQLPTDKWRYMVTTGLWPKRGNFDPKSWMSNFQYEEIPLALRLLDGFTFFSDELVKQMFRSAFINISQEIVRDKPSKNSAQTSWVNFVDSLVVVRVTGETPNDADSGYAFSRLARDILMLPEGRIVSPETALDYFMRGGKGDVLFVDDFVGSGNQFCETWKRRYTTSNGIVSFQEISNAIRNRTKFFYCPVICTDLGKSKINQECPSVKILPAHYFGSKQCALTADSAIWRDDMKTEGPNFVKEASIRAGIPDLNGQVGCWQGFHKLGLALAFSHGFPDATLPIFYSSDNGWKPLIRKGAL